MAIQISKSWGLVVPGRPPTPSEGHAQIYARVGPVDTQRLIAFDNGTCLSFGPDDLVDEFGPQDAFAEQAALVDKAVRDCQSVTQRYPPTGDDDNRLYDIFRIKPLDFSRLIKVAHTSAVHYRIPSKLASVGTVVPVYAQKRKNDIPGSAYPGSSVDTRFGTIGHLGASSLQEEPLQASDRDQKVGTREREEWERQTMKQIAHHQNRGNRPTRRGRRHGRDTTVKDDQYRKETFRNGDLLKLQDQRFSQANAQPKFQARAHDRHVGHCAQEQQSEHIRDNSISCSSHNEQETKMLPHLPNVDLTNFNKIAPEYHPKHSEYQILVNAKESDLQDTSLNHFPEWYGSVSHAASLRHETRKQCYGPGLSRSDEGKEHILAAYFRAQQGLSNEEHAPKTEEDIPAIATPYSQNRIGGGMQRRAAYTQPRKKGEKNDPVTLYTEPHHLTEQQGKQELARYADQLNQQRPRSETGPVHENTLTRAPALKFQVTSPNGAVSSALAQRRSLLQSVHDQQSIGSSPRPGGLALDFSAPNPGSTTQSSKPSAISDDIAVQRGCGHPSGSARSRAADERRAGSDRQYIFQPQPVVQVGATILAPAGNGIYSREPSPIRPPNGRFFDESRQSSPGAARLYVHTRNSVDRPASARNYY